MVLCIVAVVDFVVAAAAGGVVVVVFRLRYALCAMLLFRVLNAALQWNNIDGIAIALCNKMK